MRRHSLPILMALAAGVLLARCGQAILTAPPDSVLFMTANPPFIPAHGGVSVISVQVIEPAGTVAPDGTVVQFFTNLGRIQEQGLTNDGVARVNLTADGLSGPAVVTAVSGGQATSPSTTSTPSTTTPPSTVRSPGPTVTIPAPLGSAQGANQVSVTVAIGSALPATIVVTATPARITPQRPARIRAIVLDSNGNPVANVPIFFRLGTATATESLASGAEPVWTDTNGIAETELRTTAAPTGTSRSVQVVATSPNAVIGSTTVTVN